MPDQFVLNIIANLLLSLVGSFFISAAIIKRFSTSAPNYKRMAGLISLFVIFFVGSFLLLTIGGHNTVIGLIIDAILAITASFLGAYAILKKISSKPDNFMICIGFVAVFILSLIWLLYIFFSINPVPFQR